MSNIKNLKSIIKFTVMEAVKYKKEIGENLPRWKEELNDYESKKEYFIGVKAEKDCAYFISATISSSELIKLEKGRFGYLNMAKN